MSYAFYLFGYDSSEPSGRGQKDVLVIYRMCVLSLIISLALRTCFSYKRGLFEASYFATNMYNALQFIWLTFPNQHIKENVKTLRIQDL